MSEYAINKQTGEVLKRDEGGNWTKVQSARNPTSGEILINEGNGWGAVPKSVPAPSMATETPDFQNGGMDLVSDGGPKSYGSKEERLRANAAERRLAAAQKRVDMGPKSYTGPETFAMQAGQWGSGGNIDGIVAASMQRRGTLPLGDPLQMIMPYLSSKVADLTGQTTPEQKAQREGYEDLMEGQRGQAMTENPVAGIAGSIAGAIGPGGAEFAGLKVGGEALTAASPMLRAGVNALGRTRTGSYLSRLLGAGAVYTSDAALQGATAGASDEAAIARAQGDPIDLTLADRARIGKQYATASVPVDTPMGRVPIPIAPMLPVAGSVVQRSGNMLRKGYATPDEIASRIYNNQGRAPFRGRAAASIAATGQTLNGTVTPNNIRGFRGIENALTDALQVVETNGQGLSKAAIRNRIADGFQNIRQSIPTLDEPGIDLARLIEREFSQDAPQIQETIRRFLLKVGLDSPTGRTLIQTATNELRGSQADTLTDEVNRQFGAQPKMDAKSALQGNMDLVAEEGYGKAFAPLSLDSPGQAEALNLLSFGSEYRNVLSKRARTAGVSIDDYVLQNPLRALHEVRSAIMADTRTMRAAGNPNAALEGLVTQMGDVLDSNVPNYRQLREMYRSDAQALDRLGTTRGPEAGPAGEGKYDPGFGEKMLTPGNTSREEGRQTFKQIFDAMDDKSKRASAYSVRDVILADLDRARAAGVEDRYATAAKFQKLNSEGALQAMEEVFGAEGEAIANRVRQFVDANQYARDIDPTFNSQTINKQTAMETGDIPFASSMGRATNRAGSALSDSVAADLALMAFGGPPIASLMTAGRRAAPRALLPRHGTRVAIAETLLRRPNQGVRPPLANPPAPITPLTQNDLPRGINAFANNQSGFVRPDAAGTMLTAGGAGAGALNPIDFDGDGKKSAKERAMTAALYGGGAYAINRGVHGLDRLGRAPQGAATEFRVRPGESGSSRIQFRAGGERWDTLPTGFGSESEAMAQVQRLQAGKPLQADAIYGPPKDEFEAMFRNWWEQTQGTTAPRFSEAMQANNGMVQKAIQEMDPSGEAFAGFLKKYMPDEWAQYMEAGGGADGKSFAEAVAKSLGNLNRELDSMMRPSGSKAGRDFNLEAWSPAKPKAGPGGNSIHADIMANQMKPRPPSFTGGPLAPMRNALANNSPPIPGRKPPRLMKDVPVATRKPGQRPDISGTIARGHEQASGIPIAKAIGGENMAYQTAKREAEEMASRNVGLDEIQRRTGLVPISYRGQTVWRGVDEGITPYEANQLFYEALRLPPGERAEWVQDILNEVGPKLDTLELGGKRAPLQLGSQRTPMVKPGKNALSGQ